MLKVGTTAFTTQLGALGRLGHGVDVGGVDEDRPRLAVADLVGDEASAGLVEVGDDDLGDGGIAPRFQVSTWPCMPAPTMRTFMLLLLSVRASPASAEMVTAGPNPNAGRLDQREAGRAALATPPSILPDRPVAAATALCPRERRAAGRGVQRGGSGPRRPARPGPDPLSAPSRRRRELDPGPPLLAPRLDVMAALRVELAHASQELAGRGVVTARASGASVHELGITQGIVDRAREAATEARAVKVTDLFLTIHAGRGLSARVDRDVLQRDADQTRTSSQGCGAALFGRAGRRRLSGLRRGVPDRGPQPVCQGLRLAEVALRSPRGDDPAHRKRRRRGRGGRRADRLGAQRSRACLSGDDGVVRLAY